MLHRIEADHPAIDGIAHAGGDVIDPEHFHQPQNLHELALKVGDLAAYARAGEGEMLPIRAKRISGGMVTISNSAEQQAFKVKIMPHDLIRSAWRLRTPLVGDRINVDGRTCKVVGAQPLLKRRRIEGYILSVAG